MESQPVFSLHGKLILKDAVVEGGVVVQGGRIVDVRPGATVGDLTAPVTSASYVSPGFVDLQVNGGFGLDVAADADGLRQLASRLPRTGVTAFLPTLITSPDDIYPHFLEAVRTAEGNPGARILGAHLEGPYLSPRRPGAHHVELIERAHPDCLDPLLRYECLRLVTLAPERDGALSLIQTLRAQGISVSLGHTDATYRQMEMAFDAGATMATHLFNAMTPFGHRAPGPVAAALLDDRCIVGLIADGIHVDPMAVRLAIRAKTSRGVVLVSDMIAAAGMPPGMYYLGGRQVQSDGVRATLSDGTLAGSVGTLDTCLRNAITWGELSLPEAIQMVSANAYRALSRSGGTIEIDMPADLVLLDRDLVVETTFVGGTVAYQNPHVSRRIG